MPVPRSEWAGMALLYDFGWMYSSIGQLWGIGSRMTYEHIRDWKKDQMPTGSIEDSKRRGGKASRGRSRCREDDNLFMQRCSDEVRAYMNTYRDATVYDVALECHMTDKHARRVMRKVGLS